MAPGVGTGTALYAVVGYPLSRTLSPPMHNAAFRATGIDAAYVPHPLDPRSFASGLSALVEAGASGFNVTIPFKVTVLERADDVTEEAARAGSANTVTVRDGRIIAATTDGAGFLADLGAWGFEVPGRNVAILGAGGAARALALSLSARGAGVTCFAREPGRVSRDVNWNVLPFAAIEENALLGMDLIVNATPVGTDGRSAPPVSWEMIDRGAWIYDTVYGVTETPLVRAARERGHRARNGIGMLIRQGARAFEAWTGREAPIEIMAEAIDALDALAA